MKGHRNVEANGENLKNLMSDGFNPNRKAALKVTCMMRFRL